jgi:hypothetical protein
MKKFVVSIAWSQTDHGNVLVDAETREEAEKKVTDAFPGIHHVTGCREIDHMIIG